MSATETQLDPVESRPLATVQSEPQSDVSSLIKLAIAAGQTPTELYAILKEEREVRKEQAFNAAFAKFKAGCPPVEKRTENSQFSVTRDGRSRKAMYASLADIDEQTRKALTDNGLSYAWGDAVVTEKDITMTCVVSHVGGHKRSASCTMPHESRAGSSPQQKYASTITYLQRYSLIAALGLTTCDEDDDGNGTGSQKPQGATITEAQQRTFNDLLIEAGYGTDSSRALFLKWAKVEKIADIQASDFERLTAKLNEVAAKARKR